MRFIPPVIRAAGLEFSLYSCFQWLTLLAFISLLSLAVAAGTPPQASLRVLQALPNGALKKAEDANEIRIQFDKPVVALAAIAERPAVEQLVKIDPPLPGDFHWGSTRLLIFTPKPLPPLSSRFTVTVTGLKAMDGSALKETYRFWFETPRQSCSAELVYAGPEYESKAELFVHCVQPVEGRELAGHVKLQFMTIHQPKAVADVMPSVEDWEKMIAVDPRGARMLRTLIEHYQSPVKVLSAPGLKLLSPDGHCSPSDEYKCFRFQILGEVPKDAEAAVDFSDGMISKSGPLLSRAIPSIRKRTYQTLLLTRPGCSPLCNPDYVAGFGLIENRWYSDNWYRAADGRDAERFDRRIAVRDMTTGESPQIYHAQPPDQEVKSAERLAINDPLTLQWARFIPRHRYEIRITPQRDEAKKYDGRILEYTSVTTLTMANAPAYAYIRSGESVLESSARGFGIYLRNVGRLETATLRIAKKDLIQAIRSYPAENDTDGEEAWYKSQHWHAQALSARMNEPQTRIQPLAALAGVTGRGVFSFAVRVDEVLPLSLFCGGMLRTTTPDREDCRDSGAYRSRALVQVTDLALTLRATPVNILVSVTSIATGRPVPDASVELFESNDAPYWKGRTDHAGLALAPAPASRHPGYWYGRQLIAIAEKGDDLAYANESWTRDQFWNFSDWNYSDDHGRVMRITGDFITDRGVYRPGETVHFKGLIREQQPRALGLPGGSQPVEFTLYGPDGEKVRQETFIASASGGFDGSLVLPADGKQGNYRLQGEAVAEKSHGRFFTTIVVTSYHRPEFKVDAVPDRLDYKAGDSAELTLEGEYLYGAPMADRKADWSLRLKYKEFDPSADHPELGLTGYGFTIRCDKDLHRWSHGCLLRTPDTVQKGESPEEIKTDRRIMRAEFRGMLESQNNSVSRANLKLNGQGRFNVTAPIPVIAQPHNPFTMSFEGNVTDVNERQISGRKEIIIHPGDFYLGVKLDKRFVDRGEAVKLSAVALTPEGKWQPGASVNASIGKWEWSKSEDGKSAEPVWIPADQVRYTTESKIKEIVFKPLPPAIYLVRLESVDGRGNAIESDIDLYVTGGGFSGWSWGENEAEIKLLPEREVYVSGETARILVQSPWPDAEGLLTIERDEVITARRFHLDSTAYLLEIPLTAAEIPNVHLNVVLFKGRTTLPKTGESEDPGAPDIKSGSLEIKVSPKEKQLNVKLIPGQKTARPGATSVVTVEVRDAKGSPAPGEITLWAVDEGLLRMSGYKIPDLLSDLYGKRPHGVTMGDSRIKLMPLIQLDPKSIINLRGQRNFSISGASGLENQYFIGGVNITNTGYGGIGAYDMVMAVDTTATTSTTRVGLSRAVSAFARDRSLTSTFDFSPGVIVHKGAGGSDPSTEKIAIRTDFRILATWVATLKTDANGNATTIFRLPESLTNYKILAIAASGPDQFGDGESAVTINKPFMILPSMPRFLNLGDTVEASVVLQNQTGKAGPAGLRINLPDNSPLELLDPVERQMTLPTGPTEVRIKLKAVHLGTAQFNLTATLLSGGKRENDGVHVDFPVSITRRMETVAAAGMADPNSVEKLKLPADVYPDLGGLSVNLSSTALTGLQHGLEYLVEYPHGCLEQRSSRIKVLLMISDLKEAFPLPQFKIQDLHSLIQGEINQIREYQSYDGGLTYWKGGEHPSLFLTARVLEILTDAEKLGFTVSPGLKNEITRYLKNQIGQWRGDKENRDARWLDEAAILSALAHAGEGDTKENDFLAAHFDSLSPYEQTLLLKARVESKQADKLTDQLKAELLNHVRIEADQAFMQNESGGWLGWYWGRYPHYAFLYANDTHETAALLSTLLAIDPNEPLAPLMARWLLQRRTDGHWGNTFADGYALTSLVEYYRAQESVVPDFKGSVTLGDSSLFAQQFKGRELDPRGFGKSTAQLAQTFKEYAEAPEGLPLIFKAEGQGRMYYTARLQYSPKLENLPPVESGFTVKREYLPYVKLHDLGSRDEKEVPESLTYKAGDLVRVRLRIDTRQARHNVVIEDPLPAGLEALDAALATTSREQLRQADASAQHNGGSQGWWWWTGIDHTEIKDDRVLLFATKLEPGVLEYTYIARATSAGRFIAPPTQAEEMYRPEIFGRGTVVMLNIGIPTPEVSAKH